jgi:hypothetical protein
MFEHNNSNSGLGVFMSFTQAYYTQIIQVKLHSNFT